MHGYEEKYILMHRNYEVMEIDFYPNYSVKNIGEIINKERLPVGLNEIIFNKNNVGVDEWLFSRAIPQAREGIRLILSATNTKNNKELLVKNMGLSLTDCYWLKTKEDKSKWDDVNFFSNKFSSEVEGYYLSISPREGDKPDNGKPNPNKTSQGMLPKGWVCREDKRQLIKGAITPFFQEPYNEVAISKWLDAIGVKHVPYELKTLNKRTYSVCPLMQEQGEEIIPADSVLNTKPRDPKISSFEHYVSCCVDLGLKKDDVINNLEEMILIDYLDVNIDRHWTNFAVMRDSENLKFTRMAPLFDNGLSLFSNLPTSLIEEENDIMPNSSFLPTHKENILLVKNFQLLQNENIGSLSEICREQFRLNPELNAQRIDKITDTVSLRLKDVLKILPVRQIFVGANFDKKTVPHA
jgi:hypothetical protein